MKRWILIGCLLAGMSAGMSAQKHSVYVDEFKSDIEVPDRVMELIRLAFMDGIRKTNRVEIVDALANGNGPAPESMEGAQQSHAEYLLTANLLKREATDDGSTHQRYHSREGSYKEKFTLRLRLVRTGDGIVIGTSDYEGTGSSSGRDATQYGALENALINVPYEMNLFVEHYFKVYGSVFRAVSVKRNKVKSVYADLGYDDPIKAGLRLDVVETGTPEDRFIERKIGEVRIKEVLGPKISLCKVNKGKELIYSKLSEGKTLRLVSRQARLFDEWGRLPSTK